MMRFRDKDLSKVTDGSNNCVVSWEAEIEA